MPNKCIEINSYKLLDEVIVLINAAMQVIMFAEHESCILLSACQVTSWNMFRVFHGHLVAYTVVDHDFVHAIFLLCHLVEDLGSEEEMQFIFVELSFETLSGIQLLRIEELIVGVNDVPSYGIILGIMQHELRHAI